MSPLEAIGLAGLLDWLAELGVRVSTADGEELRIEGDVERLDGGTRAWLDAYGSLVARALQEVQQELTADTQTDGTFGEGLRCH